MRVPLDDYDGWQPLTHRTCGQVACLFFEPYAGAHLTADRVRLLDGSQPVVGALLVCGSCGATVAGAGDLLVNA